MNYIIEIKEFYSWLEYNELSATAISLWYALMNTANNARWPGLVSVPLSTLMAKTGCNKDALYRARKQLREAGRIDFVEKRAGKATEYKILPFVSQNVSGNPLKNQMDFKKHDSQNQEKKQKQNAKQTEAISGKPTQNATQSASCSATRNANLYNNNINNNNNISAAAEEPKKLGDVLRTFEENIGAISGAVVSDIKELAEKGMEPELICAAISEAAISGARSWKYVQAILRSCAQNRIQTAEQFRLYQQERAAKKTKAPEPQESALDFDAMQRYIQAGGR